MRVYIFEDNPSFLDLLMLFLKRSGHQVHGFLDGYKCPLYLLEECECPADKPCAEAVIVNTRVPNLDSIQILLDQEQKGCKLPNHNKAVMSANFTPEQEALILGYGFSIIKKPFRLASLTKWLEQCATKLPSQNNGKLTQA